MQCAVRRGCRMSAVLLLYVLILDILILADLLLATCYCYAAKRYCLALLATTTS